MTEYKKDIANDLRRRFFQAPVKFEHLGPRQRCNCNGGSVRLIPESLRSFNRGETVRAVCPGCGFIGEIRKKTN